LSQRGRAFFLGIDIDDDAEGVEKMEYPIVFDSFKIEVGNGSNRGICLLSDAYLLEVVIFHWDFLSVKDRIQSGLINVDVNSVGILEFVVSIFSEFSDINNNSGEIGMSPVAKVVYFYSGVRV